MTARNLKLSEKLKALRKRSGQSLNAVAVAAGCSKTHIWELEAGRFTNPSLDMIRRLARNYKTSVAYLAGESLEDMPSYILDLLHDIGELAEDDRLIVCDLIASLKRRSKEPS